jgi:uncharacterized membrane protein
MVTPDPSRHHPVVAAKQAQRTADLQLRIADWITGFAGSMWFVYIHVALFTIWMLFIEPKPWPMLTLIVSLEAIFLSTFVMIGQNRQSDFQQAKADHDFTEEDLELRTNTELTREIHTLTTELHNRLLDEPARQALSPDVAVASLRPRAISGRHCDPGWASGRSDPFALAPAGRARVCLGWPGYGGD